MRNMRIATLALVVLFVGIALAAFSQAQSLPVGSTRPSADGAVQPGEYTYTQDFDNQVTLCASRTADTLYLGVVGRTDGWVSVGLGSKKMDGDVIFIGFVDTDGKVNFKTQMGKGHKLADASPDVSSSVISSAMKQGDGKTSLKVALKAADFIKQGQSSLDLIFAIGKARSLTSYHSYRGSTTLALQ